MLVNIVSFDNDSTVKNSTLDAIACAGCSIQFLSNLTIEGFVDIVITDTTAGGQ